MSEYISKRVRAAIAGAIPESRYIGSLPLGSAAACCGGYLDNAMVWPTYRRSKQRRYQDVTVRIDNCELVRYLQIANAPAIARRAKGCCEYCCCPAKFCIDPFVAEHIETLAKGGLSSIDNLAFACMGCNGFKQDKTEAHDVISQSIVPLYHPRTHLWREHFAWNEDFTRLIPLTAIGHVTIAELQLNREGMVNIRFPLTQAGLHPPEQ